MIQSSGGVFEIQDGDKLIYSKKANGRFPEDGEIVTIVEALANGVTLEEAQNIAGTHARRPISFVDWFSGKLKRKDS